MSAPASTKEPQSNIEWRLFGKLDLGVSHDYDAGLAEWAILRDHLKHFGLSRWETACEIGCGAGRLTNAAAQDFGVVHALDVSAERLAQAATAPNAGKCVFHQVAEPRIPLPDGSCDLVYSVHVFQHLASHSVIDAYWREAARVLQSGGVMMIHMPMVGAHGFSGSLGWHLRYHAAHAIRSLAAVVLRLVVSVGLGKLAEGAKRLFVKAGLPRVAGVGSIYRVFSFVRVAEQLSRIGFAKVELRILHIRNGHESYVFAAKS